MKENRLYIEKQLKYLMLFALLFLQACHAAETKKIKEEKATKAFDSVVIKSKINDNNTQFVVDVANAGWARAAQGKLAIEKGTTEAIKTFGKKMMNDNKNINKSLAALADTKKIIMPRALESREQIVLDSLSTQEGKNFDKAYLQHLAAMLHQEINRFEKAPETLSDTDLQAFAVQTLPILRKQLSQCEALEK